MGIEYVRIYIYRNRKIRTEPEILIRIIRCKCSQCGGRQFPLSFFQTKVKLGTGQTLLRPCLDVVVFTSIHVCWCGLGWNLVQVLLQSTSTHVD